MLNWFAVHTKPRQEALARDKLLQQGFAIYAPKLLVRKRQRAGWVRVAEPLFPRYLFLRADPGRDNLAPVRSTPGVSSLVRFGQTLLPVPDAVIDYLRALEDPDSQCHLADQWPHRPGDETDVLEGPFAGLSGIFQAASAGDRAILLIRLLGRHNRVEVPMEYLADVK